MSHPYIMENCIICGTCWDICPRDAVEECNDYYRINDECDNCGKCLKACPNFAIAINAEKGQKLEEKQRLQAQADTEDT